MDPPGTNSSNIFNESSSLAVPKYLCESRGNLLKIEINHHSFRNQNKQFYSLQYLDARDFSVDSLLSQALWFDPKNSIQKDSVKFRECISRFKTTLFNKILRSNMNYRSNVCVDKLKYYKINYIQQPFQAEPEQYWTSKSVEISIIYLLCKGSEMLV